jgi:hypothetical protein
MTRPPRLLLLVLLAVPGCRGLRGCGASEPPAVVSAPQPVVSASPAVVSAPKPEVSTSVEAPPPPEAPYEKAWLVIIHSSPIPGEGAEALEALKRTGLPAKPARLDTNAFRGLRPCLEVVVAHAFARGPEAMAFHQRLAEAGVEAYVKNAGALDPERERKVPLCRAQAELDARARAEAWEGMPLLVENVSGATVMGATATATAPRGGEGPCLLPRGAPCAPHGGSHLHGGGLLGV